MANATLLVHPEAGVPIMHHDRCLFCESVELVLRGAKGPRDPKVAIFSVLFIPQSGYLACDVWLTMNSGYCLESTSKISTESYVAQKITRLHLKPKILAANVLLLQHGNYHTFHVR